MKNPSPTLNRLAIYDRLLKSVVILRVRPLFPAVVLLCSAAVLASCGKKLTCECLGRLYAADMTYTPAKMYVQIDVRPAWAFWQSADGYLAYEMYDEPLMDRNKAVLEREEGDFYLLRRTEPGDSEMQTIGMFSSMSGEISIKTARGRFNGECKPRDPLWLSK